MADRTYSKRQLRDIGTLIKRVEWREGEVPDRLLKVEERSLLRAAGEAYSSDPKLDKRVAKLARRIRRQMGAG